VATGDPVESVKFLLEQQIPVVVVDRDLPGVDVDGVLTDHHLGGYQATQHLIDLGHRRIACITGPFNGTPSARRAMGYRHALREAGLPDDPAFVLTGDYSPQSGLEATVNLLALDNPPTAIFACNDLMALGAIRAIMMRGLRVPDDISVVGFDNIELAAYSTPPLTTVAQPIMEIGSRAASLLIDRIQDKRRDIQHPVLPTALIVRESAAASRA
jgi:LacI family transcriptional regulator